ncbi:MAG: EAL domain-containing protein [Actinomycetota bacterium]|nr:EAL domain-containing protein [Actinomycetota bacterium]
MDRSFVEGLPDDVELRAIVAAIAAMAKALGLNLIAEGVETVEQRDSLADLGCRTPKDTCSRKLSQPMR